MRKALSEIQTLKDRLQAENVYFRRKVMMSTISTISSE